MRQIFRIDYLLKNNAVLFLYDKETANAIVKAKL